jgi:hypothetical protein
MRALRKIVIRPTQAPDKSSYMVPVIISEGEHVLLLGPVDNMNGTVAVSTWDGNVLWPVNLKDLGEIDEYLPSGQGPGSSS